jgi:superfamily II DNA or RNA helicase
MKDNYNFVRRSAILIPRLYEKENFYQQIKQHLTRATRDYQTDLYVTNYYYIETDKFLVVPRLLNINKFVYCDITNKSCKGLDIDISHKIVPRDDTQRKGIDYLMRNSSGILKLPPGTGKTVISIYAISEKKKKTIIFVNREALLQQWKDEIKKYTNMTDDTIAILSSDKYEEDLQKSIIISTVQLLLSLIKRKGNEFIEKLNKANIGVSFFDEVHTSGGAPRFSMCSLFVPAREVYGLSATPARNDGSGDIMKYHFGDVIEDTNICGTMIPTVTTILVNLGVVNQKMYKYIYWGNKFNRPRYLNQLIKSNILIGIVNRLVKKFYSEGRKSIIVCERIKLIDKLYGLIDTNEKGKFIASTALEDLLKNKIVYTTPGKIRDGVNDVKLDTLVMTSPVSNMEQLGGRIIREDDNKMTPIIIDIIDLGCRDIYRTSINRVKFYESKDWNVQFLMYDKDLKLIKMDRNKFFDIVTGKE